MSRWRTCLLQHVVRKGFVPAVLVTSLLALTACGTSGPTSTPTPWNPSPAEVIGLVQEFLDSKGTVADFSCRTWVLTYAKDDWSAEQMPDGSWSVTVTWQSLGTRSEEREWRVSPSLLITTLKGDC